ncbi:MAG: NapC/NirT family cytochrome c [Phycisphaerae bacterium]
MTEKSLRVKRWLKLGLIGAVVMMVLVGLFVGGAEYYTGRSAFCGSCHIMTPYYKSWQQDIHSTKARAACIDCHYAPGDRHTINAKLRGLSQLVSYFSGRTGNARPRPRVRDASCLREGCHSLKDFVDKTYPIRDVGFTHTKHLKIDTATLAKNADRIEELTIGLKSLLDSSTFEALRQSAILVGDPEDNQQKITKLINGASANPQAMKSALEYALAVHRDIRLRQMGNLQCTTCHAHNDDEKHFSVRRPLCYLCHFANQPFNTDTARCLSCHKPPAMAVPVHGKVVKVSKGVAKSVSGMMDHSVIIANNVNCVSCHADLVAGTGQVSRQRCAACHDLARYYEKFDKNLNTETVNYLHTSHTPKLHASCTECHDEFQHRKSADILVAKGEFLSPVMDNCAHCHPNHHHRQVEMLKGQAPEPIPHGVPNAMFGSRVNCLGCHTSRGEDLKGLPVLKTTQQACIACHGHDYDQLFNQWLDRLKAEAKDAKELESRATMQLNNSLQAGKEIPKEVREAIAKGHEALEFVEQSKGIHNRNYALDLLNYASDQFTLAIRLMSPTPSTSTQSMNQEGRKR